MQKELYKKFFIALIITLITFSPFILDNKKVKAATQDISSMGQVTGKAAAAGIACILAVKIDQSINGFINGVVGGIADSAKDKVSGKVPTSDSSAQGKIKEGDKNSQNDTGVSLSKKCIRDIVVKMLLDYFADQIVGWIQGEGKPKFVQDWDSFLKDAANVGVGEVIRESDAAFLCSPFKLQVKVALFPTGRFKQKIDCTMDQIGVNIENFMQDFQKGSWIGYAGVWRPENNYFGQILLTYDEAARRSAQKQEAAKSEGIAGGGFLNQKKCIQKNQAEINNCVNHCVENTDCEGAMEMGVEKYCDQLASCSKYEATTPGNIIGKMAAEAVTTDIEWAKNVESWTAAIVNAAVNRVIKEGLSYMTDSQAPNTDVDGNYNPNSSNTGANITDSSTAPNQNAVTGIVQSAIDELKDIKTMVIENKNKILSLKNKSLQFLQETFDWEVEIEYGCNALDPGTHLTDDESAITTLEAEIEANKNETDDFSEFASFKSDFDALMSNGVDLGLNNPTSVQAAEFSGKKDDLILEYSQFIRKMDDLNNFVDAQLNGSGGIKERRDNMRVLYNAFKATPSVCPDSLDALTNIVNNDY